MYINTLSSFVMKYIMYTVQYYSVYSVNNTKTELVILLTVYDTTPSVMFSASIVSIVVCRSSLSATIVVSFRVA